MDWLMPLVVCVLVMCCRQYEQNEGSLSALRDATELRFAANSRTTYSLQDDVVLELFTKNMGTEVRVAFGWPVWRSGLLEVDYTERQFYQARPD